MVDHSGDSVPAKQALIITQTLSRKETAEETAEIVKLRDDNENLAFEKEVQELAVEFLKSERKALKEKVVLLESTLAKSEARSDRMEASLMQLTESISHLANNRDNLMGMMLKQSTYEVKMIDSKEVLVLSNPISYG
jgi:phage shock protein A